MTLDEYEKELRRRYRRRQVRAAMDSVALVGIIALFVAIASAFCWATPPERSGECDFLAVTMEGGAK